MKKQKRIVGYYPIALDIYKKLVVVVGGGKVAQRKIKALIKAGAKIQVIAPALTYRLRLLAKNKKIKWFSRNIKRKDIRGARIVISATNNAKINKTVSAWAKADNIYVNVVDDLELCGFISPAVFRKRKAVIAVHTNGKDPLLSKDLKNFIKERWNDFLSYRHKL